ncbi:hypothetical protein GCM10010358_45160 [Streptomyces minutiscleroticus]|uniref:Uncharacterized protein n=1 Tax=Streptomyces minutiscleroticus TaxID=68238 RepID=A0A918U3M7_9ACTN|nr:hypothetical protein GCM10010358_45160 [Streptomyces minutiscleroticus]
MNVSTLSDLDRVDFSGSWGTVAAGAGPCRRRASSAVSSGLRASSDSGSGASDSDQATCADGA